jgi:hypothetical protein
LHLRSPESVPIAQVGHWPMHDRRHSSLVELRFPPRDRMRRASARITHAARNVFFCTSDAQHDDTVIAFPLRSAYNDDERVIDHCGG